MPRAFTSADVVQSDARTAVAVTSPPISFAPTVEGRCGVAVIAAHQALNAPEQWDDVTGSSIDDVTKMVAIMCRADIPADETTWQFSSVAGAVNWVWVAEEWSNVSFAPIVGRARTNQLTSVSSISTGTTESWAAEEFVKGLAVMWIYGGAAATAGWPTVSWSNGFTETNVLTIGGGTALGDMELHVARRYGTAGETGPWETTATFTDGVHTNKAAHACLAVFRAESFVGEA